MLRRSFSRNSSAASEPASYRNEPSLFGGGGGTAASSVSGSAVCIHCLCVEEYERLLLLESTSTTEGGTITSSGGSLLERETEEEGEGEEQSGEYNDDLLLLDDQDDHSSCESCCNAATAAEGGGGPSSSASASEQLRLSFLGESFECRQKVEPWIREQMMRDEQELHQVFHPGLSSRTVAPIRRGRSLGLAPQSSLGMMNDTQLRNDAHQLRRGGSECRPTTAEAAAAAPPCLFNFSFNSSTGEPPSSYYQVSSPSCSLSGGRKSPAPPGTPRLERQEALCGAWFDQSSMDGVLAVHRYQAASSMETHASASLEVDSGAYGIVHRTSIESQSSDVIVPSQHNHHHQRGRGSSLESDNSLESAGRGLVTINNPLLLEDVHQHPRSSSLLARRKCLSAGASPSSSPPCTKSAASSSGYPGRLNLSAAATGSSSEYGDAVISPSPPAEIYLTVPVLPALNPSSSKDVGFNRPSFLLRQRFRGRNDSSRSSSDSNNVFLNNTSAAAASSAIVADSVSSSSGKSRALSRSGDSLLHPRGAEGSRPHRSRSIEIGLPTAHHHVQRTEYHDLAGSARRQQWVSRLKYVSLSPNCAAAEYNKYNIIALKFDEFIEEV